MSFSRQQFNPDLEKLRDQFINHLISTGAKRRGQTRYIRAINRLYIYIQKQRITDLNKLSNKIILVFQEYLYSQNNSTEKMVHLDICDLEKFLNYLYHKDLITINPRLARLPLPKKLQHISRYYTFNEILTRYRTRLTASGFSYGTVRIKMRRIETFFSYLKQKGHKTIYKVTGSDILSYIKYLRYTPNKQGTYYTRHSIHTLIYGVAQLFRYLLWLRLICNDPCKDLKIPELTNIPPRNPPVERPLTEIDRQADKFAEYMLSRGFKSKTVRAYRRGLALFSEFCVGRNIPAIKEIAKTTIMDYQIWLAQTNHTRDKKRSPNNIRDRMVQLRSFFKYLVCFDYLQSDPVGSVPMPKGEDGLPSTYLTPKETKRILDSPPVYTTLGLRDKALLETFYSTGARVNEILHTKLKDISENGYLRIDVPKGGKDFQRVVPIGRVAVYWLQKYINKSRPLLLNGAKTDYIFLSHNGRRLTTDVVDLSIHNYKIKAGIRKRVTSHSFRVSCATHMLNNKADIRHVQDQLGHRCIKSTIRYTRLVPRGLKEIHHRCHPREKEAREILEIIKK